MTIRLSCFPDRLPAFRRVLLTLCALLIAPVAAVAQVDAWMVLAFAPSEIRTEDLEGRNRQQLFAPSDLCVGRLTVSPDRRSLFLPTEAGLARFDTNNRALVELVPDIVDCTDLLVASPDGRWWYALGWSNPALIARRLRVIDAVSRQIVSESVNSTTTQLVFDRDGHRYELRELSKDPKRFTVQRVADEAATSTPVWQVTFDGDVLQAQIAASVAGVFMIFTDPGGDAWIVRFDTLTGGETGRVRVSDAFGVEELGGRIALSDTRVYLSGVNDASTSLVLASLDAVTLAAPVVVTRPAGTGRLPGPVTVAGDAPVGYWERQNCSIQPHLPPLCTVFIETIDLESLATSDTWSTALVSAGVSPELGQIGVPSAPRITALSTAERRIELTWEPDASGALPRQFVVRGGLRGQPATIPLATLGAEARVWRSEVVPAGEYVIALVATNAAGESAPAQLDVGIETTGAAEPPAGLIALKAGRSAAELTWQPPTSGPLPTGYLIEAAPEGGPFVPAIATTLPELFVSGIPAGVWSVRVRALTVDGPGAPSELAVIDGTTCVPATDAPRALAGLVDGSRATLQWEAPASGPAASYRVHLASNASSANTIATFLVDGASTSFETAAPAGIYAVRVSAESQCATSALSNPVVLRVP